MSGQINRTGLRDLRSASADIVQVTWRQPRKRFRLAFASHRPPSRPSQRMAAHIGEIAVLMVVVLMLSGIVAAIAYVIVEMWSN
jgi:hypothetical protein